MKMKEWVKVEFERRDDREYLRSCGLATLPLSDIFMLVHKDHYAFGTEILEWRRDWIERGNKRKKRW